MVHSKPYSVMTLADHAEAWQKERGRAVPDKGTETWKKMYLEWVDFAFKEPITILAEETKSREEKK